MIYHLQICFLKKFQIKYSIKKRETEDLSHIKISKKIKKILTKRLLTIYKLNWFNLDKVWLNDSNKKVPLIEIKAELQNRENIPNKNIKKYLRKK